MGSTPTVGTTKSKNMDLYTLRKILTESDGSLTFNVGGLRIIISYDKACYMNKPLLLVNGWPQKQTPYGVRFNHFIRKYIKDLRVYKQLIYLLYLDSSYTFDFKMIQFETEILSTHVEEILLSNFETH